MTLDEYNTAITRIFEELEIISKKTAQQGLAGSANSTNPTFRQIMARQAQLISVAAELNQRLLDQFNGGLST